MYYRLLILAILVFAFGCGRKGCELPNEIAQIPMDVQIERLEKPFFAAKTKAQMAAFIQASPYFAEQYLQRSEYPSDSAFINPLHGLATNPELDSLAQQAMQTFGDMQQEEQLLEDAFRVIKYNYPDFRAPQVKTFVTGLGTLGNDLYVSDSLIVFGIDYFIGEKAKYRPQAYEYILKRYEPEKMVPAAMLLLSNRFNRTNFKDRNLLSEMIGMGKAYYFVKSVLPCVPDSSIISYTDKQIADVNYNEGRIWAHFVEKELLFEKTPFVVNKYIGERPNTPEIDATAPGRIGTWVGWQIVRKYMERNPNVTLPELMAETDYRKIFEESKYKPERRR
ncbi:gliding motility-associated lipoprotein GldB [Pontibacter mucosus]|uniref:Gliding motility-associated lipoprotein GldB n=1 Tax=Pontibacter mucosus TaxID=1649266 RepID=A0A2T5YU71_9BACT|nr:gliding motility lipoprotein GldB [Pontibacter mucosus]PTX22846.1 gliding motility-associated lipoprotein GldB [Pontibacter mucosus]